MDRKCVDVKRFILTGTPGSGKTSVVKELEKLGHTVFATDCEFNFPSTRER